MSQGTPALPLPFTLFQTQKRMNAYDASDMQCGDLSADQLRRFYRLERVSGLTDPWQSERTDFPISSFAVMRLKMRNTAIARRLFEEFRRDSLPVSFLGYRGLFVDLLDHFQHGDGEPFANGRLDQAYKALIVKSSTTGKNSVAILTLHLEKSIDWKKGILPLAASSVLNKALQNSYLPKFDRWQDNINGMGISVHDIFATHITLKSCTIKENSFQATVRYQSQDHFGLDDNDIMDPRFHNINIFRIWFVLQRWKNFAFKPFMTNMSADIEISGIRNRS